MPNPIGRSGHLSQTYQNERQRNSPAREARANRGAQSASDTASARSRESAVLEVRTADGDMVRISLRAVLQAQALVGSGQEAAFSGTSAMRVRVDVAGNLSDDETAQIGNLLDQLVTSARGGSASSPSSGADFSTLDGYKFAYRAYQQSSQGSLLY